MTTYFISASRATSTPSDNAHATRSLAEDLLSLQLCHPESIEVLSCTGCFLEEGQALPATEATFCVTLAFNPEVEATLIKLANWYSQDSILKVNMDGDTELVGVCVNPNHRDDLGKWSKVSEAEAKANQYYTLLQGEYFIAK